MKNVFHFILKALFTSQISIFCPDVFRNVGKRLDKKAKVNFKIYDIKIWETNNYHTHIAQNQDVKAIRQ